MGCDVVKFDYHIIYVNFWVSSKLTLEHSPNFDMLLWHFQSKWQDFVTKVYRFNDEFLLLLIPGIHPYVIVAEICIQKTQHSMSGYSIDQTVDVREWVCILWACSILICVVHTHSPLPVWFLDHDHIGKPSGIVNFPNELGSRPLGHLLLYSPTCLFPNLSFPLGD